MRKIDFATFQLRRCFGSNPSPNIFKQIAQLCLILFLAYSTTQAQVCSAPGGLSALTVIPNISNPLVCENGAGAVELSVTAFGGFPLIGDGFAFSTNTLFEYDMGDPYVTQNQVGVPNAGFFFSAGDFVDGTYYVLDFNNNGLYSVDENTGVLSAQIGTTTIGADERWSGLAYDASTGTTYALSKNNVAFTTTLYIMNVATGQATPIGNTGFAGGDWLAIDNDGNAFSANTNSLYQINLLTGTGTFVGPTGVTLNSGQGADFDPATGFLYTFAYETVGAVRSLNRVDTQTGTYYSLLDQLIGIDVFSAMALEGTTGSLYNYTWSTGANSETLSVSAPGLYTVTVADYCDNTEEHTFVVGQESIPASISCNNNVATGLGADGTGIITPAVVLADDISGCTDGFYVEVGNTGSNLVDCSMLDQELVYTLFDENGIPLCMTMNNELQEKVDPVICCGDITLSCTDSTDPDDILGPITGTKNYPASTTPAIPDGDLDGVEIIINVPDACSQAVEDINLILQIDHTRVGELAATLEAPDGTTSALLFNRPGFPIQVPATGCIFDNIDVTFDDEATNSSNDFETTCNAPNPAIGGDYNALQSLSVFDGMDPSGDWTLTVYDLSAVGGGTGLGSVVSAEIQITSTYDDKGIIVSDNCDDDIQLDWDDTDNTGCSEDGFGTITRVWTATDDYGNTATCEQTITLTKPALTDIDCPLSYNGLAGQNPVISCENYVALLNGHPDPDTYGEPQFNGQDINGFCMFNTGYVDNEVLDPNCPDGKTYIRTWTILDMCNSSYVECDQMIKIVDMTPPVIVCPDSKTVGTTGSNTSCSATADLDPPTTLTDNCTTGLTYTITTSAGTVSADDSEVSGLPLGDNIITYTTTDNCGNTSSCTYIITVIDDDGPGCDATQNVIVNLNDPVTNVFWTSFISQATLDLIDNCSPATALIKRDDSALCSDDVSTDFAISAPLYCCDVGQIIPITLQLTDGSNNVSECTAYVTVADNQGQDIDCPVTDDTPITCDNLSPLDPPYAGVSQTVTDIEVYYVDENNVETLVGYYDPNSVTYTCDATVYIYDTGSLNSCGIGTITRTYELRDPSDAPTASCSFDFVGSNPTYNFNTDVDNTFQTVISADCSSIPADTGPTFNSAMSCDHLYAVLTNETAIPFNSGGICFKLMREWTIYDCCIDPNNTPLDVDILNQVIEVSDNDGPVVSCSVATATVDEGDDLDFEVSATDCTDDYANVPAVSLSYGVDQDNDNGGVPDVTGTDFNDLVATGDGTLFPVGVHNVIFTATDACGNTGTCNVVVTVEELYICDDVLTGPFPLNVGSSTSGSTLQAISASLFVNGLPGPAGTMLSLDGVTQMTSLTFLCSDLVNDGPTLVDITVHLPNGTTCDRQVNLVDGTASTLACFPSQSVVQGNTVDASASATDHCTSPVTIAYEINQFSDQNATIDFTGSGSLGVQSTGPGSSFFPVGIHTVTYTATDNFGNSSTCSVDLTVTTMAPPLSNVSGAIGNEVNEMLADVEISPGQGLDMMMTNENGEFNMNLPTLENYDITPVKDNDHLNGVSTYDIVLMSKHVLGIELLDSPYKMIAADVNKSNEISTLDMLQLRKVILFIDDEFQNNTSWRFVDAGFVFSDPTNPFATTFPESYPINGLDTDMQGLDFVAVKTGDVNGTASVDGFGGSGEERTTNDKLNLRVKDEQLKAGQTYQVEVKASDFNEILGYQFTLGFDEAVIEVLGVKARDLPGLSEANFNLQRVTEGVLTSSWNHPTALNLDDDTVLFELEVRARQAITLSEVLYLSSRLTATEAYQENDNSVDLMDIALEYEDATGEVQQASRFELYQNKPNPFKDETVISFRLPEAGTVRLKVYDLSGKVLTMVTTSFEAGYNEVSIDKSDLDGSGVLYYELSTANHTAVQKMIVID